MYVEAIKDFPKSNVKLKTIRGDAFMQKMDIFRRKLWYSYTSEPSNFIELPLDKVQEIIFENKKGNLPESLEMYINTFVEEPKYDYENVVGQDSITRFDKKGIRKKSKKKHTNKKRFSKSKNKTPIESNAKPGNNSRKKSNSHDKN